MKIDKKLINSLSNEAFLNINEDETNYILEYMIEFQKSFMELKKNVGNLEKENQSDFPFEIYSEIKDDLGKSNKMDLNGQYITVKEVIK
ncbi:MAG: hypothetical protein HRS57_01035 [Mycoplasmataceae bacterium]|nr:hypothetical protein [Mycoplasmataceae bacterium]